VRARLNFKLDGGKLVLDTTADDRDSGVYVRPNGDIDMYVDLHAKEVHIEFFVANGKFTKFELPKAKADEYVIGSKPVQGKFELPSPGPSFVLVSRNLRRHDYAYCLEAVDSHNAPHRFDPAVRNIGNPYVQGGRFLLGLATGLLLGAVAALIAVAVFRPPWMG
jgi:hypothetical protein